MNTPYDSPVPHTRPRVPLSSLIIRALCTSLMGASLAFLGATLVQFHVLDHRSPDGQTVHVVLTPPGEDPYPTLNHLWRQSHPYDLPRQ